MFDQFLAAFPLTDGTPGPGPSLAQRFGGCTFGGGICRIHSEVTAAQANTWVAEAFEKFDGGVSCFGFDWLGCQFAADYRIPATDPPVLVFEPGTGEVLEIPVPFSQFHDVELAKHSDAALALTFFEEAQAAGLQVSFAQCAGYRIPLFLGGKDEVENLDVIDLEVYWSIHGQLIRQLDG